MVKGKMEQQVKLDLPLKEMQWEMAALPGLTLLHQRQPCSIKGSPTDSAVMAIKRRFSSSIRQSQEGLR